MPHKVSTTKEIAGYLGSPASTILTRSPFSNWSYLRNVGDDLPGQPVNYVFADEGLEFTCDGDDDECVQSIFLYPTKLARMKFSLAEISHSASRRELLERFGTPSKTGGPQVIKILGKYGPWDRYDRPDFSMHIQYEIDVDLVKLITLMRADIVP